MAKKKAIKANKKNNAAKKMQNTKQAEQKKVATTEKVEETKKVETKTAQKPASKPKKVETPKNKPAKQTEQKKQAAPKKTAPDAKPTEVQVKQKIESGIQAVKETITMSPDAKAHLAYTMQKRWENSENSEFKNSLGTSIDIVVFLSLVDIADSLTEDKRFTFLADPMQIMDIEGMAKHLGIKLNMNYDKKLLESGDVKEVQTELEFVDIPEELTEEEEVIDPITDPNEITSIDQLPDSLNNIMNNSKNTNMVEGLVKAQDFLRSAKIKLATDTESKLRAESESMSSILEELFNLIKVTPLITGLGSTLALYTSQNGNPAMSHAILHRHLAPMGWDEYEIADALTQIIKAGKKEQAIKNLKPNSLYKELDRMFDEVEMSKLSKNERRDAEAAKNRTIGTVKGCYKLDRNASSEELKHRIGSILNLYVAPELREEKYTVDFDSYKEYMKEKEEVQEKKGGNESKK